LKKPSKITILYFISLGFLSISLMADLWWYPHFDWSTQAAWVAWIFISLSYRLYEKKVEREKKPFLEEPKFKGRVV